MNKYIIDCVDNIVWLHEQITEARNSGVKSVLVWTLEARFYMDEGFTYITDKKGLTLVAKML